MTTKIQDNTKIVVGRILRGKNLIGVKIVDLTTFTATYSLLSQLLYSYTSIKVLNCLITKDGLQGLNDCDIRTLSQYDEYCSLIKCGNLTDSELIYKYIDYDIDINEIVKRYCNILISGAITGAITDIYSEDALRHAEIYYNEIRSRTNDIDIIAKRTGKPREVILEIKNFLFMEMHDLNGKISRFSPSCDIAQSWQRLSDENMVILPHDLTLIEHEILERKYMKQGLSQDKAHTLATQKYNYQKEAEEYYDKLKKYKGTK